MNDFLQIQSLFNVDSASSHFCFPYFILDYIYLNSTTKTESSFTFKMLPLSEWTQYWSIAILCCMPANLFPTRDSFACTGHCNKQVHFRSIFPTSVLLHSCLFTFCIYIIIIVIIINNIIIIDNFGKNHFLILDIEPNVTINMSLLFPVSLCTYKTNGINLRRTQ